MHFRAGGEGQLEDCRRIRVALDGIIAHIVCRTIDNEIAEPVCALVERRIVARHVGQSSNTRGTIGEIVLL